MIENPKNYVRYIGVVYFLSLQIICIAKKEICFYFLFSILNDMIALRQIYKFWNFSKCRQYNSGNSEA